MGHKEKGVEDTIRKTFEDAMERTGGKQKFHKLDESKSIEDQYEQQQQLEEIARRKREEQGDVEVEPEN